MRLKRLYGEQSCHTTNEVQYHEMVFEPEVALADDTRLCSCTGVKRYVERCHTTCRPGCSAKCYEVYTTLACSNRVGAMLNRVYVALLGTQYSLLKTLPRDAHTCLQ